MPQYKKKPIITQKVCPRCGVLKSRSEFPLYKRKRTLKDGTIVNYIFVYTYCKKCHTIENQISKNKKREDMLKYHREYDKLNRGKLLLMGKDRYEKIKKSKL